MYHLWSNAFIITQISIDIIIQVTEASQEIAVLPLSTPKPPYVVYSMSTYIVNNPNKLTNKTSTMLKEYENGPKINHKDSVVSKISDKLERHAKGITGKTRCHENTAQDILNHIWQHSRKLTNSIRVNSDNKSKSIKEFINGFNEEPKGESHETADYTATNITTNSKLSGTGFTKKQKWKETVSDIDANVTENDVKISLGTINNDSLSAWPQTSKQPVIRYYKGNDTVYMKIDIGDMNIGLSTRNNEPSKVKLFKLARVMYDKLLKLYFQTKSTELSNIMRNSNLQQTIGIPKDHENNVFKNNKIPPENLIAKNVMYEESHIGEDLEFVDHLASRVRVLCWVMTQPKRHDAFAVHIKATWGKRCNKLIFLSSIKDARISSVNLYRQTDPRPLWERTKEAITYLFKYHRNEAEWFLRADDDNYVIMEHLRYMLAEYDSSQPIYFGCRFKPYTKQGYMSGSAGYVMSLEALSRLNMAIQITNICSSTSYSDDVDMGNCLQNIGVKAMDSRDSLGLERFFPFPPSNIIVPDKQKIGWYYYYLYNTAKEGAGCCSDTAISFHGLTGRDMYVLEYLVYHLKTTKRRLKTIPQLSIEPSSV